MITEFPNKKSQSEREGREGGRKKGEKKEKREERGRKLGPGEASQETHGQGEGWIQVAPFKDKEKKTSIH